MGGKVRSPSRAAVLMAVARGLHREEPRPWVLDDYLALELAGQAGAAIRERLLAELAAPHLMAFSRWTCARARFAEDLVQRAVSTGSVRQYVILGAGLDSFAFRRGDLLDRLRVFEVDHPATQGWKRRRLISLGVPRPANLEFVPVDFERKTLRVSLEEAGFDFREPAVISWVGVTMYLSAEAINATLATIAGCRSGTWLVATYNQPPAALDGVSAEIAEAFAGTVKDLGEPVVSMFLCSGMRTLMERHGFADIVDFGPEQARAAYFDGRPDIEIAGSQHLVAATVAPVRAPVPIRA
jgi:methyltransferase (TIGR00027 family)